MCRVLPTRASSVVVRSGASGTPSAPTPQRRRRHPYPDPDRGNDQHPPQAGREASDHVGYAGKKDAKTDDRQGSGVGLLCPLFGLVEHLLNRLHVRPQGRLDLRERARVVKPLLAQPTPDNQQLP